MASNRLDRFGEAELRWLTAVASTMAFALRNAQLYTSVGRQVTKLATLREIDRTLNSTRELEPMLEIILTSIAEVVPYDFAAVYLLDGSIMRAVAGRGVPSDRLSEYAFETKGDVMFDQMAYERRPITIGDLHPKKLNWSILPGLENIHSWMGTPLIARDAIIGQISLYHSGCNVYTNEHIDWMVAFSNHAAIAIANALLRAELNKQARQDSLTQVLNHGAFIEELRNACQQSALTERPLSLIMLDLDNFKKYNDTYGHVVGDAVLTLTAQTIRKHIKHTDFVGRWGGEEFGIAMPRTDTVRALVVAERIRKTLTETRIQTKSGEPIPPPTASQGIASLGNQARDVDELIEEADRALYRAKSSGRDQIMVANRSISSRTNEMPSK